MKRFSHIHALGVALVLSIVCGIHVNAQSLQVATLSHEGEIKTFYGAQALVEAVNAAVNGDIVTLSAGRFNAVDLDKAITVRGAGWKGAATIISGDFTMKSFSTPTDDRLILEGLYHNDRINYSGNVNNVQMIKCRLNTIFYYSYNTYCVLSITLIQCHVSDSMRLTEGSTATCINSFISGPDNDNRKASDFDMVNCVITDMSYGCYSSSFVNCIILPNSTASLMDGSCSANNCIAVGERAGNYFRKIPQTTNKVVANYDMFKSFTGTISDDVDFTLTDEAAKTYLGTDGTQVGIYGGDMPFSTIPSNPRITKFDVSKKSSADGKLSVDIEVTAGE